MSRAWSVRRAFLSMLWHSFRRGDNSALCQQRRWERECHDFPNVRVGRSSPPSSFMVGATSASAVTQLTTPASCSTEVRVASHTYGNTYHRTVMGQYWNKGFKSNSGATSYTGYTYLQWVSTEATTINSSGFACR